MNLSSEESNLQLFKYIPDVTSQLLIQPTDSQELVQVQNLCDDLLLTGLEEGNAAWTLNGLPILLNTPLLTTDQQPFLVTHLSEPDEQTDAELQNDNEVFQLHKIISSSDKNETETVPRETDLSFQLNVQTCSIPTEYGVLIPKKTAEDTVGSQSFTKTVTSINATHEDLSKVDRIIVPTTSLATLNDITSLSSDTTTDIDTNSGPKMGKVKRKFVTHNKEQKNHKVIQQESNSTVQSNELLIDCGESVEACVNRMIEILNEDGTTTLLKVDTALLEGNILFKSSAEVECNNLINEPVPKTHEPDSTVSSETEVYNISEIATVTTAYQCKKCDFSCNDSFIFMCHYTESHATPQGSITSPSSGLAKPSGTLASLGITMEENINDNVVVPQTECLNQVLHVAQDENVQSGNLSTQSKSTTNLRKENEDATEYNQGHLESVLAIIGNKSSETHSLTSPMTPKVKVIAKDELEKKLMRIKRKNKTWKKKKRVAYTTETPVKIAPAPIPIPVPIPDDTSCISTVSVSAVPINAQQLHLLFPLSTLSNIDNTVIDENPIVNIDNSYPVQENRPSNNTNIEKLIYLCSQCADQFMTVEDCRNHMINFHKLQSVDDNENVKENEIHELSEPTEEMRIKNKCAIEKFLTADVLKPRRNKCTVRGCQYRFAKAELLARHESCHVDKQRNMFKCPECQELYASWRICSMHLWRCHQMDLDLYACPLCDYKGSTPIKLRTHLKIHSDDRDYICPDCKRGFKQPSQLRNHRIIHLNRDVHEIPKWYSQKHCDTCGKDFADSKCLKKHIQAVHSKLKPFICNVCGHSCARKAMLQMHLRQHTGEKPYECKICYYKTGDHNSLRRHIMRHSGVRPYKCPHCDYTAIQSNSYKNHLASRHPGMSGSYACRECNFKTVNEEAFTGHVNDHKIGLIPKRDSFNAPEKGNECLDVNVLSSAMDLDDIDESNDIALIENNVIQNENGKVIDTEDEETQHFLSLADLTEEQTVDTGGITIPAEPLDNILP